VTRPAVDEVAGKRPRLVPIVDSVIIGALSPMTTRSSGSRFDVPCRTHTECMRLSGYVLQGCPTTPVPAIARPERVAQR
jgi:hypothetical protein